MKRSSMASSQAYVMQGQVDPFGGVNRRCQRHLRSSIALCVCKLASVFQRWCLGVFALMPGLLFIVSLAGQEHSEIHEDEFAPKQDVLPVPPPQGAVVLFGGEGTNRFLSMSGNRMNWPVQDGALVATRNGRNTNHLVSQFHFRDADIHVEFMLPEKGSGNSGIYIHGNYELQIIRSHEKETLDQGDMGSVYGFAKPLINAARQPGQWQVYDIRYRAPRRDESGKITKQGSITAWLNGKKVQEETRFGEPRSKFHPFRHGTTPYLKTIWQRQKKRMVGPVFLQDHGQPVRFRNVWIRPLDDKAEYYQPEVEHATAARTS